MDHVDTLILMRGIERLIVVLFGGVSLVLGWKLFNSGISDGQTADLAGGNFTVKLRKVGPGAFFALFGTVILVFALLRPIDFSSNVPLEQDPATHEAKTADATTEGASGGATESAGEGATGGERSPPRSEPVARQQSFSYFDNKQMVVMLNHAKAINTAADLARIVNQTQQLSRADQELLIQATDNLQELRDVWVVGMFGQAALRRWKTDGRQYQLSPSAFPPGDQEQLSKLRPWMAETIDPN